MDRKDCVDNGNEVMIAADNRNGQDVTVRPSENEEPMPFEMPEIVVSMTSFPPRIDIVHIALESLLAQTLPPDRIVLCLSRAEFPEGVNGLPEALCAVIARGIEILWTDENLKPHKKYFYTMQKYPEAVVITVDDDKIYPTTFVHEMVESYRRFPKCVSAMHVHLMSFAEDGSLLPYADWSKNCRVFVNRPNIALFAVGAGGILYPPKTLPGYAFDAQSILFTSPTGDDIWLKAMQIANGVPVVTPPNGDRAQSIDGSQTCSLWSQNETCNDNMIKLVFGHLRRNLGIQPENIVWGQQLLPDVDEFRQLLDCIRDVSRKRSYYYRDSKAQRERIEKVTADSASLKKSMEQALEKQCQVLEQMDKLRRECDAVRAAAHEKEVRAVRLEEIVKERDGKVAELEEIVKERDGKVAELEKTVKSKDSELARMRTDNKGLSDRLVRANALYNTEKKKYDKLSKAKLGRLTLAYWKIKDSIKAKLRRWGASPKTQPQVKSGGQVAISPFSNDSSVHFLFWGHDYKFLTPIINFVAARRGVEVRQYQQRLRTMNSKEERDAVALNGGADIVFCEWALGNAVWFSKHKRPGQVLIVRMHFQEYHAGLPFIDEIIWDNVDALIVICPDAYDYMIKRFPSLNGKMHLIYNPLDIGGRFSKPRAPGSEANLGYLGMVPFRKRPDLALDILKGCNARGFEKVLRIKGKRPEEYSWMAGREDEMAQYAKFYKESTSEAHGKDVIFDGFDPEPGNWYAKCGYILSTSDYEGSHQAVAEGMAQGCVPVIRDWQGADGIYPKEFIWHDVNDAVDIIGRYQKSRDEYCEAAQRCREYALERFEARSICLDYDKLFAVHPKWAVLENLNPMSSLCVAQIVWIPVGAHNGYRVRVEKFAAQYHKLGMRTVIICLHDGKRTQSELDAHCAEFERLGCHAYAVKLDGFFDIVPKPRFRASVLDQILPIVDREKIDVVQAHAIFCAKVGKELKQARPNLIFSCVFHGIVPEESAMNGVAEARVKALDVLERDIMENLDFANFVSHMMGAHYFAKYGVLKPSCVVPSGIRSEALRENIHDRQILKLPKNRPVLGYVGTLATWQCKEEMFKLVGELHRRYPDVFFAMLTPEQFHAATLDYLKVNGLSSKDYIVQEVPFDQVSSAVSQFNAGLMLRKISPVNKVASPTKFGEMVGAGVPIVATDGIGDFSEDVKTNGFGLVVPNGELERGEFSEDTLAAIHALLEERRNEDAAYIAKASTFCKKHLMWEAHVSNMAKWYWMMKFVQIDGKSKERFLSYQAVRDGL